MRNCPICQTSATGLIEFLPQNIDESKIGDFSYASRKNPEYMSNHMVICSDCGLVFADTPPTEDLLSQAYHQADYDSSEEADDASKAYVRGLLRAIPKEAIKGKALEIGTGTGVFLEALLTLGYEEVVGVEPSKEAIDAAPEHRRAWIHHGMFLESDYQPESLDLITCFMTLEHVYDPKVVADAAFRLLKPGGYFLSVTHDYQSPVNRILGKKSPIVDIEHLQLFSKTSIIQLLKRSNFSNFGEFSFFNRYTVRYWARLFPFPQKVKAQIQSVLKSIKVDRLRISINVGNTMAWGQKPFLTNSSK